MKTHIRLALMLLASSSASAFAQDCTTTNLDSSRNFFTTVNAPDSAINQQCFLTVHPAGTNARFTEGTYEIELSGGGGGGGGAGLFSSGGGGAGAVPSKVTKYLAPGVYRLTIGTGGLGGGMVNTRNTSVGANAMDGNPTSMSNAHTEETVAGFPNAQTWAGSSQSYTVASARGLTTSAGVAAGANGDGADGLGQQSDGGDGGKKDDQGRLIKTSQDGGMLKVPGYTAPGGKAGGPTGGGGGGAGYGPGGNGQVSSPNGQRGGDGFIALRPINLAQAPAPAPVFVQPEAPIVTPVAPSAPAPVMAPRRDRG